MTSIASRLPELIAMASEGSSTNRRSLLRELTDSFFGAQSRSVSDNALYGEVLTKLASDMEAAVRAELSARFAKALDAPRSLVRKLSMDETPSVAVPVLSHSPVLTDDDLLDVVRSRGQEHLRAVSVRPTVSEIVSGVIVERGDDETLGTLLRNNGAQLSRASSEVVIGRAKANPNLHAVTVGRSDLPPDLLNEMYFVVEARLRQQILERNASLDPDLLESALSAGRNRLATEDGALPADYAECEAQVDALQANGQLTPPTLARLVRTNGQTAFLIALSRLADVDFHTARQIVRRKDLDALAVICRGADLDRALFLTFTVVILGDGQDGIGNAKAYGHLYAELTPEAAKRTLRFWKMRRTLQAA